MGAFGPNVFEDDTACDILVFMTGNEVYKLDQTFEELLASSDIDHYQVQEILVLSLIILASIDFDKLVNSALKIGYIDDITRIIAGNERKWCTSNHIVECKKCLDKIKTPEVSETYELWDESGSIDEWLKVINDIIDLFP
ncbi:hypothetical protein CLIB1444_03S01354 [[Candida] jaroonii]|uniref:Uncharacterized protein n=1 Tax=[Candida] jaroonii TaxID=467808 RepID=A0ACA9Y4Z4_9ASCO|nr:hypothetical protein CLIB1444_03S01354 [[Candida] jaroonii]